MPLPSGLASASQGGGGTRASQKGSEALALLRAPVNECPQPLRGASAALSPRVGVPLLTACACLWRFGCACLCSADSESRTDK